MSESFDGRIVPCASDKDTVNIVCDSSRPTRDVDSIRKDEVIMKISNDYIVVNKPHDVRMDGEFHLTLQNYC